MYVVLLGEGRYKDYFNFVLFIFLELFMENRKFFEFFFENGKRECQEFREGIENLKNYLIFWSFLVFGLIFIIFNFMDVMNFFVVVFVILMLENVMLSLGCWVDLLMFRGKFFFNFIDGYYYINGFKLGRFIFFIFFYNFFERKSLFYKVLILKRYGFMVVGDFKVNNVIFVQDKFVYIFVRIFCFLLVRIRLNWLLIIYQKKGYLSFFIGFELFYDLNMGIVIDIDFLYLDFMQWG